MLHVTQKEIPGDIPCGPDKVLKTVCQHCHSNPPKNGAPFPLVTYGNIQSELDGHPLWYWMDKFVSDGIMPLPPVDISDDDRATLLGWLRAGAPARPSGQTCDGDGGVIDSDAATKDGTPEDVAPSDAEDSAISADGADTMGSNDADAGDETDTDGISDATTGD